MSGTSPSVPSTHNFFVIHHPFTLSLQALKLPFLQILPNVAYFFFFWTDATDSTDCLPILLNISFFYFLVFLFSTVSCCSVLYINLTHAGFDRTSEQHLFSYRTGFFS